MFQDNAKVLAGSFNRVFNSISELMQLQTVGRQDQVSDVRAMQ